MIFKATEKGQALILIALAAIGLFAFAALAIDGSRVYSDKRHAQNAADSAALAGALVYARGDTGVADDDIRDKVRERAESNGYDFSDPSNSVTVTFAPYADCPSGVPGREITVKIVSHLDMTLARVIGRNQFTNETTATTQACQADDGIPFGGDAVVGLRPNDGGCAIDSGTSDWYISGGGIWSNGCAEAKKIIDLDPGDCLTSVIPGDPDDFPCPKTASQPISMTEVDDIMPDNPCTGPIAAGRYASGGKVPAGGQLSFSNDVFCLNDISYFDKKNIYVTNATLYVTDLAFDLKFSGHDGGFSGTATQAGTYTGSDKYDGYFMVIARNIANPCTTFQHGPQTLVLRGNVGQDLTGMILAPSTCLDLRGTSDAEMHSQIIGYMITGNGDATMTVEYDPEDNPYTPVDGNLTLWK